MSVVMWWWFMGLQYCAKSYRGSGGGHAEGYEGYGWNYEGYGGGLWIYRLVMYFKGNGYKPGKAERKERKNKVRKEKKTY